MQTFRLLVAIAAVNLSTGFLAGEEVTQLFGQSAITVPEVLVQEVLVQEEVPYTEPEPEVSPETESDVELEPVELVTEEPQSVEVMDPVPEQPADTSVDREEGLTYDQQTQRDVGEVEEPVPAEVIASWYVPETAATGLELVLQTYDIQDYAFIIDSTPSNYVYQYEFYADSPDGGHANLIGIFQYDATGEQTFQMDPITGLWE